MSQWTDAGFGTDPEGDARRRAELEHARLDPEDLRDPTRLQRLAASRLDPLPDLVVAIDLVVPEELDPHAVQRTEYPWGVAWTCACGRWEAVATGPSSAAWAGADHRRHVDAEQAATDA